MPVIVVGADTPTGSEIVKALADDGADVRAFATSDAAGLELRQTGAKVAIGDLSDGSHVEAASAGAFCAIVVADAARDGRELAFASDPAGVAAIWGNALASSGIQRLIWVGEPAPGVPVVDITPDAGVVNAAGRDPADIVTDVLRLESALRS